MEADGRKPFGADKAGRNARRHDTLEHAAENVAVAEAFVARPREGRVVRDPVLDAQAAEPAVCQIHLHLAADRALRPDREHVPENEHPNHEHRIDRGTTDRRVMGGEFCRDPREIQNGGDLTDAVIARNHLIEDLL